MTRFEIAFDHDVEAGTVPQAGELVEIAGRLWSVERVETTDGGPIVHVVEHLASETALTSHQRPSVALAPPSSFETELVYTLSDLSTRLSTLSAALSAYWTRGAA
jgi:hypothetical protein